MKKTGFTLVDLLATVILLAILGVLVTAAEVASRPAATGSSPASQGRDSARNRAVCAANLNAISKALAMYANEERDWPPMMGDLDFDKANDYRAELKLADLPKGTPPTAKSLGVGAQQNLCLLVYKQMVKWDNFVCPSTGTKSPDRKGQYGMGDGKKSFCDYGIQIPYFKTPEGDNHACMTSNMNGIMVIMADQGNADPADNKTRWSPNHPQAGENVLNAGYSVKFIKDAENEPGGDQKSVNLGGYDLNNIYLADKWKAGPKLAGIGTKTQAVTDENGVYDSVIYSWHPEDKPTTKP